MNLDLSGVRSAVAKSFRRNQSLQRAAARKHFSASASASASASSTSASPLLRHRHRLSSSSPHLPLILPPLLSSLSPFLRSPPLQPASQWRSRSLPRAQATFPPRCETHRHRLKERRTAHQNPMVSPLSTHYSLSCSNIATLLTSYLVSLASHLPRRLPNATWRFPNGDLAGGFKIGETVCHALGASHPASAPRSSRILPVASSCRILPV